MSTMFSVVLCWVFLGQLGQLGTQNGTLSWHMLTILVWLAFLSSYGSQFNNMRKQVENLLAEMYLGSPNESRE